MDADIFARSGGLGGDPSDRPGFYKPVGIGLAVGSGVFIGVSFVLKKVGLLRANEKYNEVAGEGYGSALMTFLICLVAVMLTLVAVMASA